jgi:hypothetical protein
VRREQGAVNREVADSERQAAQEELEARHREADE